MRLFRKIKDDLYYIGANDRRIALFENAYPVPDGISYNAYLLIDEKIVLFDAVDGAVVDRYLENVAFILDGRQPDYLVVSHMEPDHSAAIARLIELYPNLKIIGNAKTIAMLDNFFWFDAKEKTLVVLDNETINTGRHSLKFIFAPMVHWPEVMTVYDETDKILFSADAFGSFGAVSNLYADEIDLAPYMSEARRYYANIVGKYGAQVNGLFGKLADKDIQLICPLHGVLWRNNLDLILDKYAKWANYEGEENSATVVYGSVYGHTAEAAEFAAAALCDSGVKNIKIFDVAKTHPSYIIADAFRSKHLVFASVTVNNALFPAMEHLIRELGAHGLKNRSVSVIENGSWAPAAAKKIRELISDWKNTEMSDDTVTVKSAVQWADVEKITANSAMIARALNLKSGEYKLNNTAFFKLSYGLFVLTAAEKGRDNGCIINTALQLTDSPKRISIAVNKANYTAGMIRRTGKFNVSVLTENAKFATFQRFGFQTGKTANKFDGLDIERADNGIAVLKNETNAYFACKVESIADYGSHYLFVGEVTESVLLSGDNSTTYDYYFKHIKPAPPKPNETKKKGFVCKICGYVYDGEPLPEDFICPICKHGAADFEPIQ